MLRFYDTLRLNQKSVDAFERLALGMLEPGAAVDRGAERLVRQTRFLVAAFRDFETQSARAGIDQHGAVQQLLQSASPLPYRHVVVTVGDRTFDPLGLAPAHWDLLSRVPGLEHLDVVATDRTIAGAFHERSTGCCPGSKKCASTASRDPCPRWWCRRATQSCIVPATARRKWPGSRGGSRGPCGTGSWPRPREPRWSCTSGCPTSTWRARSSARPACRARCSTRCRWRPSPSPRRWMWCCRPSDPTSPAGPRPPCCARRTWVSASAPRDVDGLDRALAEQSYLGDPAALARLVERWEQEAEQRSRMTRAARAGRVLLTAAGELAPLQESRPLAGAPGHVARVPDRLTMRRRWAMTRRLGETVRARHLRARAAVLATLTTLRDAFARFDAEPVTFHDMRGAGAALDRRADLRAPHRRRRRARGGQRQRPFRRVRPGAAGGAGGRRVAGAAAPRHLLFAGGAARAGLAE